MLSQFRLTGNEKSGHGIVARFGVEIHIYAVTVSHHGGDGIHLHYCFEDPRIDEAIGRVLDQLESSDLADNTLVIFSRTTARS